MMLQAILRRRPASVSCRGIAAAVVCFVVSLCAGCQAAAPASPASDPTAPRPGSAATPTPVAGPAVAATSVPTGTEEIVLTWWTPEFLSARATEPSGPLLADYLTEYETAHAGKVRIKTVLKAKYGKGGLLDYLRTAQAAAPGILPDLVSLDIAEVEQAQGLGVLQPLDNFVDPQLAASFYPFARQDATIDGHLFAIPVMTDLEHLAYDRSQVPTAPTTWAEVLSNRAVYLFPAGSPSASGAGLAEDVQPIFISQYLSAGGSLNAENHQLTLNEEPLLRVLSFYNDAKAANVLSNSALKTADLEETWSAYAQGAVAMADVSARRYLAGQDSLKNSGFAPIPGQSGAAVPVGRGWAMALVTTDPARQRAAAELMIWLAAPERNGPWTRAASWLPAGPSGWAAWSPSPYHEFLQQQLAAAINRPGGTGYPAVATQLRKAIVAVLKDGTSPQQAAQAAARPTPAK